MKSLFIAFAAVVTLSSCHYFMGERVYGNGHITSKEMHVGSFDAVDAGGAIEVHVKQDATPSVKVETDENLVQFVDVYTEGNTLMIHPKRGFNLDPSREIVVYVSAPDFKSMEISGASKLISDNAITPAGQLNLTGSGASKISLEMGGGKLIGDISGATTLNIKGQVSNFNMQASGASDVNGFDLIADDATLDVSGATGAEITVNKTLKAEASGASHIHYKGNASVSENTSGASSVSKEN